MPQSLANLLGHFVFSTKHREPWLRPLSLRRELAAYMSAVLRNQVDSPSLIINAVDDHVHALVSMSRRFAAMNLVQIMKTETSKWLKRQSTMTRRFAWQNGYAVFSVSQQDANRVVRYIRDQEEHHRTKSYQEEFRELCRRHGVVIDERYVWD